MAMSYVTQILLNLMEINRILKMIVFGSGLFTNDVSIFWGLRHPLVLMSAYHQLLACPLVLQIDDIICEPP